MPCAGVATRKGTKLQTTGLTCTTRKREGGDDKICHPLKRWGCIYSDSCMCFRHGVCVGGIMPPKYNTETEGETNWEGIIKGLNIITGLIYVAVLVTLLFFWPTSSLIALVVLHVIGMVVLALHVTIDKVMSGVLSGTVGSSSLDSGLTGFFQLFAWHHIYHRRSAINYCVVIAHLFIIFMNMLGYLESTIKEMPPSTIRFGSETQLDHTRYVFSWFRLPPLSMMMEKPRELSLIPRFTHHNWTQVWHRRLQAGAAPDRQDQAFARPDGAARLLLRGGVQGRLWRKPGNHVYTQFGMEVFRCWGPNIRQ